MTSSQWWVFDRPLMRDPMFAIGLVIGVAGLVSIAVDHGNYGWLALALSLITAIPLGLVMVGIILGTPREYLRARRKAAP